MEIKFTDTIGNIGDAYKPKPASSFIPEWYKNMDSYIGKEKKPNGNGQTAATIKRCMPVFDAIVSGYIIVSVADVYVKQDKDALGNPAPYYEWSSHNLIDFHSIEQAPDYPNRNGLPAYPKWINPWAIKTPKGYSVLITQPMHRESPFTILPGVVDTDNYSIPVNFPFVLNDINFEGLIPAGTPLAQIIPFKRDNWKMKFGGEKELEQHKQMYSNLSSKFFDKYKTMFRAAKEYK